jgi:serine/threonine protein kinase
VTTATLPRERGSEIAPGYRVVGHLSRGDVTDVYDVWSEERGCRCVAKVLRPECDDQKRRRRLAGEGRLLQRFSHPHIVRAYEVLRDPEVVVILETLTGETLAHLIARRARRLPLDEVCVLGIHLCSAAHYLHGHGLLHLDLNPANVVAESGRAKVLDLGVAGPPGRVRPGVGTREFMAPEQVRGDAVSAAADVWGIGAVMYAAAAGQAPFRRLSSGRYEQVERAPDPIASHRRVPPAFGKPLMQCLDADPAKRPSVAELAGALAALAGADDIVHPRKSGRRL